MRISDKGRWHKTSMGSYDARRRHIMSKKSKNKRYVITSEQLFDAAKPKFNGFGCGYGAHGKAKYDRNKEKARARREGFE